MRSRMSHANLGTSRQLGKSNLPAIPSRTRNSVRRSMSLCSIMPVKLPGRQARGDGGCSLEAVVAVARVRTAVQGRLLPDMDRSMPAHSTSSKSDRVLPLPAVRMITQRSLGWPVHSSRRPIAPGPGSAPLICTDSAMNPSGIIWPPKLAEADLPCWKRAMRPLRKGTARRSSLP